jgi:hypothetical protein
MKEHAPALGINFAFVPPGFTHTFKPPTACSWERPPVRERVTTALVVVIMAVSD